MVATENDGGGGAAAPPMRSAALPILYQHAPEWGLVSTDPACLAAEAFLRFGGVEHTVVNCNNDAMSPNGKLPFLRVFSPPVSVTSAAPAVSTAFLGPLIMAAPSTSNQSRNGNGRSSAASSLRTEVVVKEKLFAGLQDIAAFYKSKVDSDNNSTGGSSRGGSGSGGGSAAAAAAAAAAAGAELSREEQASAQAFVSLVTGRLSAAALAELWCEPASFAAVARPTQYTRSYPFPLDWLLSWQTSYAVKARVLESGRARSLGQVYDDASMAYRALADLLDDKPFFCGASPTELDAHVYGHLAFVLKAELPSNKLRPLVCRLKPLVAFFNRVHSIYFDGAAPADGGGSGSGGGAAATSAAPTSAPVPAEGGLTSPRSSNSSIGATTRPSALRSGTGTARPGGSTGGGGRSTGVAPEADDPSAVEAAARRAEAFARRIFASAESASTANSTEQQGQGQGKGKGKLAKSDVQEYLQAHPEEKQLLLGKSFTWSLVFDEMDAGGAGTFDAAEFTTAVVKVCSKVREEARR